MAGVFQFLQFLGLRPRADSVREIVSARVVLGDTLGRFVHAVSTVSDEADPVYVHAVEGLRRDPDALAAEVAALAFRDARSEYALLRCAVMALGSARAAAVVPVLIDLATAQHILPDNADPEAATHAMTVKSSAVEALEQLARSGVTEAAEALVDVIRRDVSLTVRGVGLAALREVGTPDQLERAAGFLPRDQWYLRELKREPVGEVPQIWDPRRHLLGRDKPPMRRPDLEGYDSHDHGRAAARGTPRVKRSRPDTEDDHG